MRCGLMRIVPYALTIALMLAVTPTAAFSESVVCHTLRRGESATQAARRLTGNSWNAYRPWFQISNASSRYVPKSQYNRVRTGWRACLIGPAAQIALATESRETHVSDVETSTSKVSEAVGTPDALA